MRSTARQDGVLRSEKREFRELTVVVSGGVVAVMKQVATQLLDGDLSVRTPGFMQGRTFVGRSPMS